MGKKIVFREIILWCFCFFLFNYVHCQENTLIDSIEYFKDLPFNMPQVKQPQFNSYAVNIKDFGAVNDGMTSNTKAIASAISMVTSKGGGTIVISEGLWLTGPIELKSNVRLHTEKGAIILFTRNYEEYPMVKTSYEGKSSWRTMSPIYAKDAENIAITGEGLFNGNGDAWRPVKKSKVSEGLWKRFVESGGILNEQGTMWYPTAGALKGSKMETSSEQRNEKESEEIREFIRPVMVNMISCKKIKIQGVSFQNSAAWCLHPLMCENLIIDHVIVKNEEWATNGDGIDLESCKNTLIINSIFDVGDDGICMKSGRDEEGRKRGMPTENVIVNNCKVYNGHGGFVVGSEMSGGIRNILVKHCSFIGTDNGLRFKSTRGRGGIVENIFISDITMANIVHDAILYDLYYMTRENNSKPPHADESTPLFRKIYMKNIICKGSDRAILFQGLPEMMLKEIVLENVTIESRTGIICKDADSIQMKNVQIYSRNLPIIDIQNSTNIIMDNFSYEKRSGIIAKVSGGKTNKIIYLNTAIKRDQIELKPEVGNEAIKVN
jgi:hypothetical protein